MDNKLGIATYNLSIAAVKRHPDRVVSDIKKLQSQYHVILIQEAGAAKKLLARVVRETGWHLWAGTGKTGQASDPILYSPSLKVNSKRSYPLTGRVWMGLKGAGSRGFAKPKFLLVITFVFNGGTCHVGNIHATPSQYLPIRARIARKQFNKAADALNKLSGDCFVGGDLNQVPGHRNLGPFRHLGMRSANRRAGMLPTHGKRIIDDIYFEPTRSKTRFLDGRTHDGASDHRAFGADFQVG